MATEDRTRNVPSTSAAPQGPQPQGNQLQASQPQGAQFQSAQPQMFTGSIDGGGQSHQNLQIREIRPRGDETKLSIKTSEFWIYLAAVGAILIASEVVGINAHHRDYFRADRAWFLIAIVTIGYLISRGIAKAGSATRSRDTGANMSDGRSVGRGQDRGR